MKLAEIFPVKQFFFQTKNDDLIKLKLSTAVHWFLLNFWWIVTKTTHWKSILTCFNVTRNNKTWIFFFFFQWTQTNTSRKTYSVSTSSVDRAFHYAMRLPCAPSPVGGQQFPPHHLCLWRRIRNTQMLKVGYRYYFILSKLAMHTCTWLPCSLIHHWV